MSQSKQSPTTDAPELVSIVLDVLGDLAFMVTDDGEAGFSRGTVLLETEVTYYGQASGSLQCWCTREFAAKLAANLLGIEPEEGEAQVAGEDAVREFMNVLCGQLVTIWHGTEAVFNLSIPTIQECCEVPGDAGVDPKHQCRLSIEGEPLVCLYRRTA